MINMNNYKLINFIDIPDQNWKTLNKAAGHRTDLSEDLTELTSESINFIVADNGLSQHESIIGECHEFYR